MKAKSEKAIITYLAILKENESKGKVLDVSLKEFLEKYEELFSMKRNNPYQNMYLNVKDIEKSRENAYKELHNQFVDKTIADVLEYRNTLLIVNDRVIPEDLKQKAKEKKLHLVLKKDTMIYLSGYNIFYKKHCLTQQPYQLSEKEVRKIVSEFPTSKSALIKQENNLLDILHDESIDRSWKISALRSFKMSYTTHDFQTRINRYLFRYCTDKTLALETIGLCARANIVNLQNGKPIMLRYCKAADDNTNKNRRRRKQRNNKNR